MSDLLKSVLVILVSFFVRWFFGVIGVEIDDATFNAIVAALVTLFLSLIGVGAAQRAMPNTFK